VLEFTTESYWHFEDFAFTKILPAHVFNDDGGVGYDEWNTWNPGLDPSHPFVTCGPYILTGFETGSMYNLTSNPDYHYIPAVNSQQVTTSTTISTTTTSNISDNEDDILGGSRNPLMGAVTTAISFGSIEIMIVVTVVAFRDYRRHKQQIRLVEEEQSRDWITEIFG
jgi:hypothetical protein